MYSIEYRVRALKLRRYCADDIRQLRQQTQSPPESNAVFREEWKTPARHRPCPDWYTGIGPLNF